MERTQHHIDATGKTLGRLATEVAVLLRGKGKIGFVLNQDLGDFVTVSNADKIIVTGRKADQKMYYRHSGVLGNLKEISYKTMHATHPERILELAVKGMLPVNRLRQEWMKRLTIETSKETHAN
jgi:large subunit ribosomal protein L13